MTPRIVASRIHDTDRWGRKVAEVTDPASGEVLNLAMVGAGRAAVYARYCSEPAYGQAQERARAGGLGIWNRAGEPQRPWDWRHR